jgi:hypothetical protein
MRTAMLPLVDVVGCNGPLADKPVDTALTSITNVFDFYGRDLAADSGHTLMIRETGNAQLFKTGSQNSNGNWRLDALNRQINVFNNSLLLKTLML